MAHDEHRPPAGRGRRFLRLAGMTAASAAGVARVRLGNLFRGHDAAEERLHEMYRHVGEHVAETLGELKGAAMKVGQMASQVADMLPPELAAPLAKLQRDAPPMPFDVIREQIERELGAPPERLFDAIDPEPFAAASIGQVHRARTDDGREVVVKVQYPGVDEACDADLRQVRMALRVAGAFGVDGDVLDRTFDELRDRLHEELDYCNEADNVRRFRALYRDDPRIVVPDVVGERSAQHVLTLTYEPGDRLSEVTAPRYDRAAIDALGELLFRVTWEQLLVHHVLHGDPHPGNFAARPDGTLVIYDYGCVKQLRPDVVAAVARFVRAVMDDDYERLVASLYELELFRRGRKTLQRADYELLRDAFAGPLKRPGVHDFGRKPPPLDLKAMMALKMRYARSVQPPVETMLIERVVLGQHWNVCKLGARFDAWSMLRALTETAGAPASGSVGR